MDISLPDFALVALIGASGSGKSTFAARHFAPTEVLSSDTFRGLVADDENEQSASGDAFAALHHLAEIRLKRRRLTVIDATNVQPEARGPLLEIARRWHAVPVAIVLDVPEALCRERNRLRADRAFGPHVVRNHQRDLRRSLRGLKREGFRHVFTLKGDAEIAGTTITRVPLWTDRRAETGLFDVVGDIHGCHDELVVLLHQLGYVPDAQNLWRHPENRRLIFLGDLVDRGPKVVEATTLVMNQVENGGAFCVPGNHDDKLKRKLTGKNVALTHGLETSLEQIAALPEAERGIFTERFARFVDKLVSHLWLDNGRLVAVHAGLTEDLIGRASGRVREFALYGEATGETNEHGLPVRRDWAASYRGGPVVVYGHTPVRQVQWRNNTLNIDTGCVFGGNLTALRWPEREVVSVPARQVYRDAPWLAETEAATTGEPSLDSPTEDDGELPDIGDFLGRRTIETRLAGRVVVAAGNAAAAMEVMSRFAAHPRWLIYLPPTMSPVATSFADGYLERPEEAFVYFAAQNVEQVVCQEKHMGSRAVLIVCRDAAAAQRRFGQPPSVGSPSKQTGIVLTRTGRAFFDDAAWNHTVVCEVARALEISGLWEELETDWVCLDAEIMPWNAKARGLLREQYAPVGAAGTALLAAAWHAMEAARQREIAETGEIAERLAARAADIAAYQAAYARYCWPVQSVEDLRVAPFHLLAAENRTFLEHDHAWHQGIAERLARVSSLVVETAARRVNLGDAAGQAETIRWWEERTAAGGEGMVVKPLDFMPPGRCQPAVKVRGREYLRIIYGPEYLRPENLERLRARGLGAKRALALREFALGVESLERFVRAEPAYRVHECVFGVLALESEPVDPRL